MLSWYFLLQDFQVPVQLLSWQRFPVCVCVATSQMFLHSHRLSLSWDTGWAWDQQHRCFLYELPASTGSCRRTQTQSPNPPQIGVLINWKICLENLQCKRAWSPIDAFFPQLFERPVIITVISMPLTCAGAQRRLHPIHLRVEHQCPYQLENLQCKCKCKRVFPSIIWASSYINITDLCLTQSFSEWFTSVLIKCAWSGCHPMDNFN